MNISSSAFSFLLTAYFFTLLIFLSGFFTTDVSPSFSAIFFYFLLSCLLLFTYTCSLLHSFLPLFPLRFFYNFSPAFCSLLTLFSSLRSLFCPIALIYPFSHSILFWLLALFKKNVLYSLYLLIFLAKTLLQIKLILLFLIRSHGH